jgi:hypothetical protein
MYHIFSFSRETRLFAFASRLALSLFLRLALVLATISLHIAFCALGLDTEEFASATVSVVSARPILLSTDRRSHSYRCSYGCSWALDCRWRRTRNGRGYYNGRSRRLCRWDWAAAERAHQNRNNLNVGSEATRDDPTPGSCYSLIPQATV